jgi:S-DNA-T family DNA segregation ATPase FtsK/SpoIIIE
MSRLLHSQAGRIEMVLASHRVPARVIGGLVKTNFPVRLVGSVASPEDAKVASGLAQTGTERLLGRVG